MRLSLSEILNWMDVSHPETTPDPQYWYASDPDDPDCLITVGVWTDRDGRLVAEIVETRGWDDPSAAGCNSILWHMSLMPEGPGDDQMRVRRLVAGNRTLPPHDLHALRRELLQFRDVVRVIRDGGFMRNRIAEPSPPRILGDPDDGVGQELGPPPLESKLARRRRARASRLVRSGAAEAG